MMKLSVIIPCFNSAKFLGQQLEALARQEWSEPWEVILADNGSTDDSIAIAWQYQHKFSHLRIVDASAIPGAAYARNAGAKVAKGELLAFCDADDEVAPGWVAAMGEALAQYEFVAGRLEREKLNEPWLRKSRIAAQTNKLSTFPCAPNLKRANSCNFGLQCSLFREIGGFDESLLRLEDFDLCLKAQIGGKDLHFIPEALVYYRYRPTLTEVYKQAVHSCEAEILLFKKYQSLGIFSLPIKKTIPSIGVLVKYLVQIRDKSHLAKFIQNLGCYIGYKRGIIKYHYQTELS